MSSSTSVPTAAKSSLLRASSSCSPSSVRLDLREHVVQQVQLVQEVLARLVLLELAPQVPWEIQARVDLLVQLARVVLQATQVLSAQQVRELLGQPVLWQLAILDRPEAKAVREWLDPLAHLDPRAVMAQPGIVALSVRLVAPAQPDKRALLERKVSQAQLDPQARPAPLVRLARSKNPVTST